MSKIFNVFLFIILALATGCQSNKATKLPHPTGSKNQFGDTQNDIRRICGFSKGNWLHAEKYQKIVTQRGYSCETINSNSEKQRLPASRYSGQMLCTFATSYKYGNVKQWSKRQKDQEYVQAAKKRRLTCGVNQPKVTKSSIPSPPKEGCYYDPKSCNSTELCNLSTIMTAGAKSWDGKFQLHIKEAKKRGLTCGVKAAVQKTCSASTPEACSSTALCNLATFKTNTGSKIWSGAYDQGYVKEAKNRGLTCGVKSVVEKTCSASDPEVCTNSFICKVTVEISGGRQWSKAVWHEWRIKEAKKRGLSCGVGSSNQQIAPASSNSAELKALRLERQQIEANLRAMEELIARQKRAANAPYKACLSNCLLNNRAGSGFAGLLNGLAQCNNSCAPLKYGGAVIPPSWERNQRRLKTIDCTITQMSKNQATARCNQF